MEPQHDLRGHDHGCPSLLVTLGGIVPITWRPGHRRRAEGVYEGPVPVPRVEDAGAKILGQHFLV